MANQWRSLSLRPKILGLDATAFIPVFVWMFWPSWPMFIGMVAFIILIGVLEKKGLTLPVFYRFMRGKLRGGVVEARPWWHWNRFRSAKRKGER